MLARPQGPYGDIARRWLALVERRQAHLIELRASGRWKRYFTAAEIDRQMDEIGVVRDRFARIALGDTPAVSSSAARGRPAAAPRAPDFAAALEWALSAASDLQESAMKSGA